jgi:branched-chain amino acid transport system permease protein
MIVGSSLPLQLSRFVDPFAELLTDIINMEPHLLQLLVFGLLLGGVYALTAQGLTMIFGVMDVINFAHGVFLVVGMYSVWWISGAAGISPILLVPVALVVLFVVGAVVHLVAIEPIIDAPQQNQLIVTLGVLFILQSGIEIVFSSDPRSLNLKLGTTEITSGVFVPHGQIIALGIAVIAMLGVWVFLNKTRFGRIIRGTADNRAGARFVGINVPRVNYITFGIGAALAGLAGAAIALDQRFDPYTGDTFLLKSFVVVVLGGLGSFSGAFVGGLFIGLIDSFGAYYLPGTVSQVFIFLLFLAVLMIKPSGLFGGDTA